MGLLVFFDNALAFAREISSTVGASWNQPVDYKEWGMPAHYGQCLLQSTEEPDCLLPAAILQAPFYDLHSVIFC